MHRRRLQRFVSARVPAACVDDVLQTAALRAVERSDSLQNPERALAWLYRIHRNAIADTLRKRARRQRLWVPEANPLLEDTATQALDVPPLYAPCQCSLVQAQRLRPAYAAVLTMVDAGGGSLTQAAQSLGISLNNATVRLHRARKALRTAMLNHCGVRSLQDCAECACTLNGCCTA